MNTFFGGAIIQLNIGSKWKILSKRVKWSSCKISMAIVSLKNQVERVKESEEKGAREMRRTDDN